MTAGGHARQGREAVVIATIVDRIEVMVIEGKGQLPGASDREVERELPIRRGSSLRSGPTVPLLRSDFDAPPAPTAAARPSARR